MSCKTPTNIIDSDHSPGEWNPKLLRVGYTYGESFSFWTPKDKPKSIADDDFEMIVKDSLGATVDTLTIGDGLSKPDDNTLAVLIRPATTGVVGIYTHVINWTQAATGQFIPVLSGEIEVI